MNSPKYIGSLTGISTQPNSLTNLDDEAGKLPLFLSNDCPICLSTYSGSNMLITCSQGHRFCKDCLQLFLKAKLLGFKGETMTCPQDSCKNPCDENVLRSLLDNEEIKLYEQKKLEKMVSKNPNMKFCPQAGCSRVYTPTRFQPFTICKCNAKICNACANLWHEKKTCLQATDMEFKAFQKANDVKFCVMCKTVVQKVEGCSHISCPVCDYDWCWACGREYTAHHITTCPKKWSPRPPEIVLNERARTEEQPKERSKAKKLILLALSLPVRFLFFAFFLCELWKPIRELDSLFKKVVVIILGVIVSFGYVALVISIFVAKDGDTGGKIFVGIIFLTPFVVHVIYEICKIIRPEGQRNNVSNKRWMSRDAEKFGYKYSMNRYGNTNPTGCVQTTTINQCKEIDFELQGRQCYNFDTFEKGKQLPTVNECDRIFDEESGANRENGFSFGRKNDDQICDIKII